MHPKAANCSCSLGEEEVEIMHPKSGRLLFGHACPIGPPPPVSLKAHSSFEKIASAPWRHCLGTLASPSYPPRRNPPARPAVTHPAVTLQGRFQRFAPRLTLSSLTKSGDLRLPTQAPL